MKHTIIKLAVISSMAVIAQADDFTVLLGGTGFHCDGTSNASSHRNL
jgi:hypothetical protein